MTLPQTPPPVQTPPINFTVDDATTWPLQFNNLLDALFDPGTAPLLAMGQNLWRGLALIVVVWTGLKIAFSGQGFKPWDLVAVITALAIPWTLLSLYTTPVPGVGLPFPAIIPVGADEIAQRFANDASLDLMLTEMQLSENFRQNLADARAVDGPRILQLGAIIKAAVENFTAWLTGLGFGIAFTLCFLLISGICFAQVLWAQLALAILVFLGPVLIPFMVWSPLSFLFWGWFRAIWTYSLYSIIAAAIVRVWTALSVSMIESLNAHITGQAAGLPGPDAGAFLIAIFPLVIAAVLAAIKVPELAGMIVGTGGGGGMGGAIMAAASMGKSKLLGAAARGGPSQIVNIGVGR